MDRKGIRNKIMKFEVKTTAVDEATKKPKAVVLELIAALEKADNAIDFFSDMIGEDMDTFADERIIVEDWRGFHADTTKMLKNTLKSV